MIYFIWAKETPFVKVGFTEESVDLRRNALSAGCPYYLEVVHSFSLGSRHADRIGEKRIHVGLAMEGRHRRGEWFCLPNTHEAIQTIIEPYLNPNTWREVRTIRLENGRECVTISAEAARLAGLMGCSQVAVELEDSKIVISAV